jgi:hypothetical protein
MPEETKRILKGMRNAILFGGFVIIILLGLLAFVVFSDRKHDSDIRAREARSLVEARIESCRGYNVDKTLQRNFQVQNILTLVQLQGKDVETTKTDPRFQTYVDFVNNSYPYKQCSAECVIASYDPNLVDCGSAKDEAGNP